MADSSPSETAPPASSSISAMESNNTEPKQSSNTKITRDQQIANDGFAQTMYDVSVSMGASCYLNQKSEITQKFTTEVFSIFTKL